MDKCADNLRPKLYIAYGALDSIWQSFCYYTMGSLTNDPRKLAYYTGFYKSVQALGAAAISKLDAVSSSTCERWKRFRSLLLD